jgi:hypothetical protein
MWRAAPLVALLLSVGCGHNIGDPCQNNVDCNPLGDRFCDIASPNGYCTQENCDVNSCPGNSVCVRFFTPVASEPCDPTAEPRSSTCRADERCVCDHTLNGACVVNSGHCASNATERRWCQARCSNNGDCRSGYECRETGTLGAEPVATFDDMGSIGRPAKFCAPSGISTS